MAKKSIVEREKKRERTVARLAERRVALKEELRKLYAQEQAVGDEGGSGDIGARIIELQDKLQKMPRNASPSRLRRRCALTGRPRGVYRKFGLARTKLREYAMTGAVPGLKKASW